MKEGAYEKVFFYTQGPLRYIGVNMREQKQTNKQTNKQHNKQNKTKTNKNKNKTKKTKNKKQNKKKKRVKRGLFGRTHKTGNAFRVLIYHFSG